MRRIKADFNNQCAKSSFIVSPCSGKVLETKNCLQSWSKVLGTSQLFHNFFYHLLETDLIACKISLSPPPPLFPPLINVEIGMMLTFCSIFNIERGGGREGALGVKLKPVNVQVSQHF